MSAIYRTSQIKLNHPNKVLAVSVSTISGKTKWPFANGNNDPWYAGSSSSRFYQWTITLTVTPQEHGSHLTRDDFVYNGLDVIVGDWIAGATDGKCLKIISILAKTRNTVTCVVEDWLRYNTFKTTTGNGMFNTGPAIVFTLNEYGFPMLDPMPTNVANTFFPTVYSRFQYLNPQINYVLEKENHGFIRGDVVSATSNGFVKADEITASQMIGVVIDQGPGPNYFMIMPNNRIIDFDPNIPGQQGDRIYVDIDGTLSAVSTPTNKVAFLNIKSAVPTVLSGNPDPILTTAYGIKINGQPVSFAEDSNAAQIVASINAATSNDIIADVVPYENIISSDTTNIVGAEPPFSANINGTEVEFVTVGSQYAGYSTPEDMSQDINSANISNLVATATSTVLTLTELNGGSITIVNVSGANFVGASNVSGLPAFTPATNQEKVQLTRTNGGEILIFEPSDLFQTEVGLFSAHTGSLPLAINLEEGIRQASTTVVADINERDDALSPGAGDQAYVIDSGKTDSVEWGLYLYDGNDWVEIANKDSAATDARTLTTTISMPLGGSSTVQNMDGISPGRKITTVSVIVDSPLVGASQPPVIIVGSVGQPDLLMSSDYADLTTPDTFIVFPEYVHPVNAVTEFFPRVELFHYGATAGNITVKVTYV